ncbi:helix-turn-helix domain-containing protein [Streptomyces chryseus]
MGFSSDRGRTRLPIDHAPRHPTDAISLAILASSEDGAVERHGQEGARKVAVDDVDGTPAAVGSQLRAAREHPCATLAGVSYATGISTSTLSRIKTGRASPPWRRCCSCPRSTASPWMSCPTPLRPPRPGRTLRRR